MFGKRNALSTAASKRNVGNTAVRDRIRMFEQRENVNEVKEDRQNPRCSTNKELNPRADAVDRMLHGQLSKDNVAPRIPHRPAPKYDYLSENCTVTKTLKPPTVPPRINSLHSRSEGHLNRKFSIKLNKNEDIVQQETSSPPATTSIATKALYVDRDRLKQQSLVELQNNLRFIEKLRDLYLEEIRCKEAKMFSVKNNLLSFDNTYHSETESLNSNDDHYEVCGDNGELCNQTVNELVVNRYSHNESEDEDNSENVDWNQQLNTESDFNSDDSEDNVYLSLNDCLSGVSLSNIELYRSAQGSGDNDCQEESTVNSDGSVDEGVIQNDYDAEMKQIAYRVKELVSTEEKYVSDLETIVERYMGFMQKIPLPGNLRGKQHALFGNISEIYAISKDFLETLKTCGCDHEKMARTFLNFKSYFRLYVSYSKTLPEAQALLPEFECFTRRIQEIFEEKLGLSSYLITPIQRMGRYRLLLEGIQGELNKKGIPSDDIEIALDMIKRIANLANGYVAIGSIKNCPTDLSQEAGPFIMRDHFNIIYPHCREGAEGAVFLFEEIMIFTLDTDEFQKTRKEEFSYVKSLKMSDLMLISPEIDKSLTIKLEDFSKREGPDKRCIYTLHAKSKKVKENWMENVQKRLWDQANTAKEIVKARHLTRRVTMAVRNRNQEDHQTQGSRTVHRSHTTKSARVPRSYKRAT